MLSEMYICLKLKSEIECQNCERQVLVFAEEGGLGILRTGDFDIYAVVLRAADALAEVELIGLACDSVVYDGKILCLSPGERQSYTFRAGSNPISVELSCIEDIKKEEICRNC